MATPVPLLAPESPAPSACRLLDVVQASLHASRSEWLFFRELRVGTGHRNSGGQRLDGFALNCLPHTAMRRICYEVKISRSDFLAELKHPLKRRIGLRYSNEFYFVTPLGLLASGEVPVDCGLIEIDQPVVPELHQVTAAGPVELARSTFRITVYAPWRDTPGPTWQFVAAMLRNQRRAFEQTAVHGVKQHRLPFE